MKEISFDLSQKMHGNTQLNCLKIKWIQSLLDPTNALWKDLLLY